METWQGETKNSRSGLGLLSGQAVLDDTHPTPQETAGVGFQGEENHWLGRSSSLVLGSRGWCQPGSLALREELCDGDQPEETPPQPRCPVFTLQFKNPLILLLLASALVSVLTKQYEDAVSIAMVSVCVGGGGEAGSQPHCQGACGVFAPFSMQGKRVWPWGVGGGGGVQQKERKANPHPSLPPMEVCWFILPSLLVDTWVASS